VEGAGAGGRRTPRLGPARATHDLPPAGVSLSTGGVTPRLPAPAPALALPQISHAALGPVRPAPAPGVPPRPPEQRPLAPSAPPARAPPPAVALPPTRPSTVSGTGMGTGTRTSPRAGGGVGSAARTGGGYCRPVGS
jgi:hypothetical protein